jgi:glycosyltransferase 2 family protein
VTARSRLMAFARRLAARNLRIASGIVTAAFFAAVVWLLQGRLRDLDPSEILAVLRALSPAYVAVALLLTALAYAVLASYDRLAARYARVRLPAALGLAIAFVSYAFNFNLGAMVGAFGFRIRLYSRAGVDAKRIGAIAACSIVTNWCGCLSVLGAMLIADPSAVAIGWDLSPIAGRLLGALLLAPVAAYLLAAAIRTAPVRIRGTRYPMPGATFALTQIGLASTYWLLVPIVLYALQPASAAISYSQLTVAYGLAALGGIIVRVPAGLGVIEAVFLEIFSGRVGAEPILGMLFAWRAVFLLAPLTVAAVVLAVLELRGRATAQRATPQRRRARA